MTIDKSHLKFFMAISDHSVSGESFELYHDPMLDMLVTLPRPEVHELGKYYESDDYISHTDRRKSLFEKAYQAVKRISIKRKISLVNSLADHGKILDIGAGTGDFLIESGRNGWQVFGTEPNPKAREIASGKGLDLASDTINFDDHSFDVITMWHVLEHVYDLNAQIVEIKRLLKPSGTLVIAVPNFKSLDAKLYRQFWAAFDVPRHLWHFSKTAIRSLFESEQFRLVDVLPMKFDAYYVCLLSEKYKTGHMNVIRATINAMRSNLAASGSKEYSSHIYIIKNK